MTTPNLHSHLDTYEKWQSEVYNHLSNACNLHGVVNAFSDYLSFRSSHYPPPHLDPILTIFLDKILQLGNRFAFSDYLDAYQQISNHLKKDSSNV